MLSVLKEAKSSYDQKKASLKAEQAIKRSQTFDVRAVPQYQEEPLDDGPDYEYGHGHVRHNDAASVASSRRSHGSSRSKMTRSKSNARPALTMSNLKTHSEVSSVAPSRPPVAHRSPPRIDFRMTGSRRPSSDLPPLGRRGGARPGANVSSGPESPVGGGPR